MQKKKTEPQQPPQIFLEVEANPPSPKQYHSPAYDEAWNRFLERKKVQEQMQEREKNSVLKKSRLILQEKYLKDLKRFQLDIIKKNPGATYDYQGKPLIIKKQPVRDFTAIPGIKIQSQDSMELERIEAELLLEEENEPKRVLNAKEKEEKDRQRKEKALKMLDAQKSERAKSIAKLQEVKKLSEKDSLAPSRRSSSVAPNSKSKIESQPKSRKSIKNTISEVEPDPQKVEEEMIKKMGYLTYKYYQLQKELKPIMGGKIVLGRGKGEPSEMLGESMQLDLNFKDPKDPNGKVYKKMTREHFEDIAYGQRSKLFAQAKDRYVKMGNKETSHTEDIYISEDLESAPKSRNSLPSARILVSEPEEIGSKRKEKKIGIDQNLMSQPIQNELVLNEAQQIEKPPLESPAEKATDEELSYGIVSSPMKKKKKAGMLNVRDLSDAMNDGYFVGILPKTEREPIQDLVMINTKRELILSMFEVPKAKGLFKVLKDKASPIKNRPASPMKSILDEKEATAKAQKKKGKQEMITEELKEPKKPEIEFKILRKNYEKMGLSIADDPLMKKRAQSQPHIRPTSSIGVHPQVAPSETKKMGEKFEANWKKALKEGVTAARIKKTLFY